MELGLTLFFGTRGVGDKGFSIWVMLLVFGGCVLLQLTLGLPALFALACWLETDAGHGLRL